MSRYDPGKHIVGGDWLCLHRNENLFIEQSFITRLARTAVERVAVSSYPDPACVQLREVLAQLYAVEKENVFVGNGSDEVLSNLLWLFCRTGGYRSKRYTSLNVLDVSYRVYPMLAERLGVRLETIPGETFMTGKIAVRQKGLLHVIDSPNAITGGQIAEQDLQTITKDGTGFLVWDNCYGEFADDKLPTQILSNLAVVRTFSKFYGLAGLRVGYCIGHEDLVSELLSKKDVYNVNAVAQQMAVVVLQRSSDLQVMSRELLSCRTLLTRGLESRGFKVRPPFGNFVFATHTTCAAERLQKELESNKIMVRRFAEPVLAANSLRITVPPQRSLERLFKGIDKILGKAC